VFVSETAGQTFSPDSPKQTASCSDTASSTIFRFACCEMLLGMLQGIKEMKREWLLTTGLTDSQTSALFGLADT